MNACKKECEILMLTRLPPLPHSKIVQAEKGGSRKRKHSP